MEENLNNPQMPQQPPYQAPQPNQQPPQYQQPQPQYGQPPYQQPYQAPVQTRPSMGLYIGACIVHLIFCLFMILSSLEVIKTPANPDTAFTIGSVMMLLGAFSALLIFIGYRVYCKSRLISAPCTMLIIAQFIYTLIFLILLFVPKLVLNEGAAIAMAIGIFLAFLIMLIGRLIVGGKFMGNKQPGLGLMVIAVAIAQILMVVLGFVHSNELQSNSYDAVVAMQRLGVVTWIYIIATTLESLLALIMFANKDK
ncbi:MAG: hypothetical protein J5523_04730 [Muribaculaceae bacterium]|nr:hypothetical protein [Muribaculaceae bacterium]